MNHFEQPVYMRATAVLIMLALVIAGLYFARDFFIPISLAALLAILISPVVRFLHKKGLPRPLAIIICIVIMFLLLAGFITLISAQVMVFAEDIPELKKNVGSRLNELQSFITSQTDISPQNQINWAKTQLQKTLENSGSMISNTLAATTSFITVFALIPIYIFFFLFYKDKFKNFLFKVNADDQHYRIQKVVEQIKSVVQSYLSGVLIVIAILAVLNTIALTAWGIKYALFIGVLAAMLNIIPYIGPLVGNILATAVAFLTKDAMLYPIGVLATFAFIQFLENNFLTPAITGSKVSINPLATIMALIIGGMLWGVVGMIIFIPFLGILKVVFDNIENLKPYGYLLGTETAIEVKTDKDEENFKERVASIFNKSKKQGKTTTDETGN